MIIENKKMLNHKKLEEILMETSVFGKAITVKEIVNRFKKDGMPINEDWVKEQVKHMRTDWR